AVPGPDARWIAPAERATSTAVTPSRGGLSLRARVALACVASACVVLVAAGFALTVVLRHQQDDALDRQLAAVVRVVRPALVGEAAGRRPAATSSRERLANQVARAAGTDYVAVAVQDGQVVAASGTAALRDPAQVARSEPGWATVATSDGTYRVSTVVAGSGLLVSVGLPTAPAEQQTRTVRRSVLLVGVVAVVVAALLGWVVAEPALRPLRRLVDRVRTTGGGGPRPPWAPGTPEVDEVAMALDDLDARLVTSQARERQALEAARGFAASASHELRTPLTSMSTDLAVLAAHEDLPAPDRRDVVESLRRGQERLQVTLQSLEQLARGELLDDTALEPIDLAGLLLQLAGEVGRHDGVRVVAVVPGRQVVARTWAPGLRLTVENLVRNAARHGEAHQVRLTLQQRGRSWWLLVDDDGRGLPSSERERVLGRFVRGSTASGAGSGLGMALVQQQAQLHGWDVALDESPLGGLRVTLGPITAQAR
ncbi:MAG TPA: HAMP domain-containing sensor histidine kinase, partial [Actinomycetales bacterium]|nr:HAMP domain-containing sensor histidine kinase [Actinomycetales bacterium]